MRFPANRWQAGKTATRQPIVRSQGVKVQMCVTSPPYFRLRDYGHTTNKLVRQDERLIQRLRRGRREPILDNLEWA